MADDTTGTGSLLAVGMQKGLNYGVSYQPVTMVAGNPSGLIIAATDSGLCIDLGNGAVYMSEAIGTKGWIRLGSKSF